jgi:hypothetical protein
MGTYGKIKQREDKGAIQRKESTGDDPDPPWEKAS